MNCKYSFQFWGIISILLRKNIKDQINPNKQLKTIAPSKPAQVLLGLILEYILGPPKYLPEKYAAISVIQTDKTLNITQIKPSLCSLKNKKEAEITSKYPLSIFQATIDQFEKNKDDIIIQAKKTGFPIHKEQNFYETILNEYW